MDWNGKEAEAAVWTDVYSLQENQEVLAIYRSKSEPSPFDGGAAAAWCPVGKGGVIVLGTQPSREALQEIVAYAFEKAGMAAGVRSSGNVVVVPRSGAADGIVLCEVNHEKGEVFLDGAYQDVVSGEQVSGTVSVEPYTFQILKKID